MVVACEHCGEQLIEFGDARNVGSGDGKHFVNECRDRLKSKFDQKVKQLTNAIAAYHDEKARAQRALNELAAVRTPTEGVWRWQGDGEDHLDTLSCPVVMWPETLQAILERSAGKDA